MKRLMMIALGGLMMSASYADDCVKVLAKDTKVTWMAFKTPAKVGVKGSFPKVQFENKAEGKTLADAISGTAFKIDTNSISTGDTGRDATIVNSFFSKGNLKISGKVKSFARKKLVMNLTMNGVTKEVPLAYEVKKDTVTAKGFIDILDFNGNKALAALHKACGALHEGKTWSDVEIGLEFTTTKC